MTMRLQVALISMISSSNSFFAELSKKISERINLYVYRHPRDSLYYVVAYIPKFLTWNSISDVMKDHRESILKIFRYAYSQETYLITVKQCCEFTNLQKITISLFLYLTPYIKVVGCTVFMGMLRMLISM